MIAKTFCVYSMICLHDEKSLRDQWSCRGLCELCPMMGKSELPGEGRRAWGRRGRAGVPTGTGADGDGGADGGPGRRGRVPTGTGADGDGGPDANGPAVDGDGRPMGT